MGEIKVGDKARVNGGESEFYGKTGNVAYVGMYPHSDSEQYANLTFPGLSYFVTIPLIHLTRVCEFDVNKKCENLSECTYDIKCNARNKYGNPNYSLNASKAIYGSDYESSSGLIFSNEDIKQFNWVELNGKTLDIATIVSKGTTMVFGIEKETGIKYLLKLEMK